MQVNPYEPPREYAEKRVSPNVVRGRLAQLCISTAAGTIVGQVLFGICMSVAELPNPQWLSLRLMVGGGVLGAICGLFVCRYLASVRRP